MVVYITDEQLSKLKLGSEGQYFKLHDMNDFVELNDVVPFVKKRFSDYLNEDDD